MNLNLNLNSLSHRMVRFDLGSMTFPNAGGQNFLRQGQFSKIVNSCPILLKFGTHMCRPHANIPVQYSNNRSGQIILDLGAMTFPSAGGPSFLGQGNFSKIVNSCPILLKLCTHLCKPHANVHV
jgi:hypothetical protein